MTPTKQTVYLPKLTFPLSMKGEVGELFSLQQGYFFTPEQLNEYTQEVIKQALETAAEKAEVSYEMNGLFLTTSITTAFEQTFEKFKV